MSKFAERLSELIKDKNISQNQICKDLNIYSQKLSKWKLGQIEPDIDQLILLASYFNVTIDYLTGYENEDGTKIDFKDLIKK